MRQFEKSTEKRREKIAEKRNLEHRKKVKDKRYHLNTALADSDSVEDEYEYYPIKGEIDYD